MIVNKTMLENNVYFQMCDSLRTEKSERLHYFENYQETEHSHSFLHYNSTDYIESFVNDSQIEGENLRFCQGIPPDVLRLRWTERMFIRCLTTHCEEIY